MPRVVVSWGRTSGRVAGCVDRIFFLSPAVERLWLAAEGALEVWGSWLHGHYFVFAAHSDRTYPRRMSSGLWRGLFVGTTAGVVFFCTARGGVCGGCC